MSTKNSFSANTAETLSSAATPTMDLSQTLVRVSLFKKIYADNHSQKDIALVEIKNLSEALAAQSKESLPLIKLATFGERQPDKKTSRTDANVLSITGVELDYDNGELSYEDAVNRLCAAPILAIVYTTTQHTEEHPRLRVLVPFLNPFKGTTDQMRNRRTLVINAVEDILGITAATESHTLSQAFFIGRIPGCSAARSEIVLGKYIDSVCFAPTTITLTSAPATLPVTTARKPSPIERVRKIISGEALHPSTTAYAMRLASKGLQADEMRALLEPLIREAERDPKRINEMLGKELDSIIASAIKKAPAAQYSANGVSAFERQPLFWASDATSFVPPPTLVSGVLPQRGSALIYAPSGAGKTALSLDIASSIAQGKPWRNRNITNGGGLVVYIASENPGSIKGRVSAYIKANPDARTMPLAIVSDPLTLADPASVTNIIERIKEAEVVSDRPCVSVFLDTLAAAMLGLSENDAKDMNTACAALARIGTEIKCLVLTVHHSGKDSANGARGSSVLRAAVDTEIEIKIFGKTRQATVTKQRDLPTGEVFEFETAPVTIGIDPETGKDITGVIIIHGKDGYASDVKQKKRTGVAQAAILQAMQTDATKIWNKKEFTPVAAAVNCTGRNTITSALKRLEEDGLIENLGLNNYRIARDAPRT